MAATKAVQTVLSSTSVSAGGTQRNAIDLRTSYGGVLTMKMTNGATGPTLPCLAKVLIAHNTGSTPSVGAAGSDWKTYREAVSGGTANNAVTEIAYDIPPGVMHLETEFTGHTGQAVTCEAVFSEVTAV